MAGADAGTVPLATGAGARRALAWLPALLLPLLIGLGTVPMFDVDEGAFAEATREMLASGDWGHTTLQGEARFDKPILVYWLQAISASLLGVGPLAFRLPSALCVWGMGMVVARFATPRWGAAAGVLASLALVCSTGMLVMARAATADALLNLLLCLAALDLWRHMETAHRAPLRRAALWIGLGLLTKGPVALLIPGAALLLWCLASRRRDTLRRAVGDPWAWLILLGVALPWYAYALQRHGWAFVDGFILRHNLQRFASPLEGHHGSLGYYLLMLPLLCLPWSAYLWTVLRESRASWADPLSRYLLGWVAFVLVFFSLSGTKLPHYVLYGFCPLALLIGKVASVERRGPQCAFWWTCAAWIALLVAAPLMLLAESSRVGNPLYRALLTGLPVPWSLVMAGLLALGATAWLARVRRWAFALRAGLATAGGALLIAGWVAPWWGEALQGPIERAARFARTLAPAPVVQWGVHWPSAAVVLQAPMPRRAPEPCGLALVRLDRLDAPGAVLLHAERGVGVVRAAGAGCP
jgi:4-amino-4-deoxy-L-arabinose transferase-like glycosyltransferase